MEVLGSEPQFNKDNKAKWEIFFGSFLFLLTGPRGVLGHAWKTTQGNQGRAQAESELQDLGYMPLWGSAVECFWGCSWARAGLVKPIQTMLGLLVSFTGILFKRHAKGRRWGQFMQKKLYFQGVTEVIPGVYISLWFCWLLSRARTWRRG